MKIKLVNTLLGILLLTGITFSQDFRYPTDVVFISPNYINKFPHYSTIANAVTYLSTRATVSRPYTMWIACDTVKISDWATQKATLRSTYVVTGKIKISGFFHEGTEGIGGGGTGTTIPVQDVYTLFYNWLTWDGDNLDYPEWIRNLGDVIYGIDIRIHLNSLHTTDGGGLSFTQDSTNGVTVSIDEDYIDSLVLAKVETDAPVLDSNHIVYDNSEEEIRATYTFKDAGIIMGDSSFIIVPLEAWSEGLAGALWRDSGNRLHFSGNGGESSYSTIPGISDDDGYLWDDTIIVWTNLSQALKDSILWRPAFGSLYIPSSDPDTIITANVQAIQDFSTGVYKNVSKNDSSFTITYTGYYRVSYSVTTYNSSTATTIQLYVDDVANTQLIGEEETNAERETLAGSAILYLSASDVLELKITIADGSGIIKEANFNIERIRN